MRVFTDKHNHDIVTILTGGGVGILRTDTLYGIVARADNEQAVERVYRLKNREPSKSPIVLVSSQDQLFDQPDGATARLVNEQWPGKASIIIPSSSAPIWLTRGNASVAYRLPDNEALRELLSYTGPLIAPSANPEGAEPAMTIAQAIDYFCDSVDFYIDEGEVTDNAPSQLLRVKDGGGLERLR